MDPPSKIQGDPEGGKEDEKKPKGEGEEKESSVSQQVPKGIQKDHLAWM